MRRGRQWRIGKNYGTPQQIDVPCVSAVHEREIPRPWQQSSDGGVGMTVVTATIMGRGEFVAGLTRPQSCEVGPNYKGWFVPGLVV